MKCIFGNKKEVLFCIDSPYATSALWYISPLDKLNVKIVELELWNKKKINYRENLFLSDDQNFKKYF